MNLLDWLLIVLVLAYALSGYWQGFITGAFATGGLLLGGLFGVWLAPIALGDANPSLMVSLGALFIVILSASLGQATLQFAGSRIRDRITWQPVRALDAVGGAALSAVAVLGFPAIVPHRAALLRWFGQRSLAIYLLHGLVVMAFVASGAPKLIPRPLLLPAFGLLAVLIGLATAAADGPMRRLFRPPQAGDGATAG